ncbi:MAG: exosortase C-terminal domain/associated protein EpsI [Terriglobia bacterium]
MHSVVGTKRVFIMAVLLVGAWVLLQNVSHGERVMPHRRIADVPMTLGEWQGMDAPIEPRILKATGVDDHLNRIYTDSEGEQVGVYVGYYESQRTGDTIHSPKNCLPGAGWQPVQARRLTIDVPGSKPITVNEYLIERGLERDIVLYWYQGRGRVVASEYWGKFWLVADAITSNRTDGCLVRLYTSAKDGEDKARARTVDLSRRLYLSLQEVIPN